MLTCAIDNTQDAAATCSFSEMVPAFAELFDPEFKHVIAMVGRMKRLIQLGATVGGQTSRGKAGVYSPADVRELMTLMEMGSLGVSPAKAIELYDDQLFFGQVGEVRIEVGPRKSALIIDTGPLRDAARKHLPQLFTGRRDWQGHDSA